MRPDALFLSSSYEREKSALSAQSPDLRLFSPFPGRSPRSFASILVLYAMQFLPLLGRRYISTTCFVVSHSHFRDLSACSYGNKGDGTPGRVFHLEDERRERLSVRPYLHFFILRLAVYPRLATLPELSEIFVLHAIDHAFMQ